MADGDGGCKSLVVEVDGVVLEVEMEVESCVCVFSFHRVVVVGFLVRQPGCRHLRGVRASC